MLLLLWRVDSDQVIREDPEVNEARENEGRRRMISAKRSSRVQFGLLIACVAVVCAAVVPNVASAGGGNSANAKSCQEGGWRSLYTPTGGTFVDQGACVSYAANGGVLATGRILLTTEIYPNPYYPGISIFPLTWGVVTANGLQPDSWILYYGTYSSFGGFSGLFGGNLADSNGNYGPSSMLLYCTIGWTNVYATGLDANGTAITSNTVSSPCEN
jgi:hypothetical protein